jgi:hypothetical protein
VIFSDFAFITFLLDQGRILPSSRIVVEKLFQPGLSRFSRFSCMHSYEGKSITDRAMGEEFDRKGMTMKHKTQMNGWRWLPILLALALLGDVASGQATTQPDAWRADLRWLAAELPRRHINLFHDVSPQEFQTAVDQLEAEIPALSDHTLVARLTRIAASAREAHTFVNWESGRRPFNRLPIRLRLFKDGLFVTAVAPVALPAERMQASITKMLEMRVVRIGNADIEQAMQAVLPFVSAENQAWRQARLPVFLTTPEFLHAAGLISSPERAVLEVENGTGRRLTFSLPAMPREAALNFIETPHLRRAPTQLHRTRPASELYWYEFLEESRALYFQFNAAREMPARPFAAFTRELLAQLDARGTEKFVIDLRRNSGGSTALLRPLIEGILARPAINQHGRLFVAIDCGTASSAMLNALELRFRTQAILLGEPSGGKPNHYGELGNFTLPNSGLAVFYSTRFFQLLPDDPPSVAPEWLVETSSAEYFAGSDPVLDAVLAYGR